jgi:acetate kinase
MNVLVLNAGSSSVKFGIYRMGRNAATGEREEEALGRGIVESDGEASRLRLLSPEPSETPLEGGFLSSRETAERILQWATEGRWVRDVSIDAAGCRVVHGGARFIEATRVTPAVLEEIRALGRWAPLHNALDAEVIEAVLRGLPDVPAAAVFDTAFHHTLPEVAFTYALDRKLCREYGLRRYGFHGISHRYVSERLSALLSTNAPRGTEPPRNLRTITCHLGNGASVCALKNGVSVDVSMGLTPLEGLAMGTRSGDVDPGLLIYLLQSLGMTPEEADHWLNHESGLKGLSELSSDARVLEEAASRGDGRAEMALEIFAYRACKYIGAYAAALEGLDAVAFAGGIGEHSPSMRRRICRRLEFLGLTLDPEENDWARGEEERRISAAGARTQAWVIPTDEELQIARETFAALAG